MKYNVSMGAASKKSRHPLLWLVEDLMDEPSYFDKAMFGCRAVYLHGRLALVLASGEEPWNGLLLPTEHRFHDAIKEEFRDVAQHPILKKWLYLPQDTEDFESTAAEIVMAVRMNDPRFGVEPKERRSRKGAAKKERKRR